MIQETRFGFTEGMACSISSYKTADEQPSMHVVQDPFSILLCS